MSVPLFFFWGGYSQLYLGGVRVRGDAVLLNFWCCFVGIFILSCGIAVLQNQVICGIQKFSGNSTRFSYVILCSVYT